MPAVIYKAATNSPFASQKCPLALALDHYTTLLVCFFCSAVGSFCLSVVARIPFMLIVLNCVHSIVLLCKGSRS